MSTQTPWRRYRTQQAEPFLVALAGASVIAAVGQLGNDGALCEGTVQGMAVGMKTQRGPSAPRRVPTYTISLSRWTMEIMPEVCLHPLALPHLFVTEQIARGDIMGLLGAEDVITTRQSVVVDRSREDVAGLRNYFGAMLGQRIFRVTLQTDFDLDVRAARS